jgi:hypothetical protein
MANSSDNIETEISLLPNNEQRRSFALMWYFFVHSTLNYKIGIELVNANFQYLLSCIRL